MKKYKILSFRKKYLMIIILIKFKKDTQKIYKKISLYKKKVILKINLFDWGFFLYFFRFKFFK
jgi:hypothetical protein